MPIPGYNNIDSSGVLLSTSNLTTLSLSDDESTVSVGPGNRWRDVYAYLQPSGLAVVGGRVGEVGVPGLLLGGGISFYSSQYGFGADNVIQYEVCFPTAPSRSSPDRTSVCSPVGTLWRQQQAMPSPISSGRSKAEEIPFASSRALT